MVSISLCMIVRNAEATLGRCLSSISNVVDEINIIDTGSIDDTIKVARQYTDRIFHFKWIDHFAEARNFSFEKATKDYILWLDADDVIMEEDQKQLMELKKTLSSEVDSVSMNYILGFDDYGNVRSSIRRNRLVKRDKQFKWHGVVHEYLAVSGVILNSDLSVTHKSEKRDASRNLLIYENQLSQNHSFIPRDLFYFANELKDHYMYERAISYYEEFLLTGEGWIEDNIASCGRLADCYHHVGESDKELESVLRSFRYDQPRPEFCCRLGFYFLSREQINSSIYWYKQALEYKQDGPNWGFQDHAFTTWLPHLQLCVCYDRKGNDGLAYHHNEIAYQYRPKDSAVLHNKKYLEEKLLSMNHAEGKKE
ncbi:glycosyltransferase family 2 protein [Pseudalkalibacillus hwajinpoensis]|uniref:Glycosyltransferase family 2 protein n=1 Tax=Guptibacillus hwajinpoensis TaxID=208199 RepID=A0A4U1MNW3_9BACL|nr:glycosyltransferase family 2 protein [Pseudalkalibacillus hwajinpoensis]TKD72405.1 glycosyltransferase family 2 protein [Pseudalkalibacillus hwajinpoensis]